MKRISGTGRTTLLKTVGKKRQPGCVAVGRWGIVFDMVPYQHQETADEKESK